MRVVVPAWLRSPLVRVDGPAPLPAGVGTSGFFFSGILAAFRFCFRFTVGVEACHKGPAAERKWNSSREQGSWSCGSCDEANAFLQDVHIRMTSSGNYISWHRIQRD